MKYAIPVTADDRLGPSLSRAHWVAIATYADNAIITWRVYEVEWDVLHETEGEDAHDARVAVFLREHGVGAVVANHVGAGLRPTLKRVGIPVFPAKSPSARGAVVLAAVAA